MATILAADIGYGFTKAMVRGRRPLVILSLVGPAERIRFDEEVVGGDSSGITVKVDGRWYFVGERANSVVWVPARKPSEAGNRLPVVSGALPPRPKGSSSGEGRSAWGRSQRDPAAC